MRLIIDKIRNHDLLEHRWIWRPWWKFSFSLKLMIFERWNFSFLWRMFSSIELSESYWIKGYSWKIQSWFIYQKKSQHHPMINKIIDLKIRDLFNLSKDLEHLIKTILVSSKTSSTLRFVAERRKSKICLEVDDDWSTSAALDGIVQQPIHQIEKKRKNRNYRWDRSEQRGNDEHHQWYHAIDRKWLDHRCRE